MGGALSSIPDRMISQQKILQQDMMEKNIKNQIRFQDRMLRKQIAMQIAITRERTYWCIALATVGWIGVAVKKVPKMAAAPLSLFTLVTAYQADLAFYTKANRIKKMAEDIENDPSYWFVPTDPAGGQP
ncbi:hypothetical protein DFA_09106 [Cavenderia fasciculata]|uniref:Uncharacterized protein n=1 Tax=Cavenderia fasciculata TaxID=261658 RepID=F4Q6P9_CACFS|nr:uncharacterized protein DFA_09106 [Cavenderia fasciculata]EGG16559.1 hypothetical protein DFA_09106 [Cavenderia fasciculata]|eukprot:XP_004354959.1 hypothetical protein DFA_09106 [Cavenderia fasciculata]